MPHGPVQSIAEQSEVVAMLQLPFLRSTYPLQFKSLSHNALQLVIGPQLQF